MSSVNLYDVLDLDPECTKKDIIQAYRKLVKIYYPDRPTGDSDLFELINQAFDVLSNDEKRAEYDSLQRMSKKVNKSHGDRKDEFKHFQKLQTEAEITKTKDQAELEFKSSMALLDDKVGFRRDQYFDEEKNKLQKEDMLNLAKDLELERDQDDIEYKPQQIFAPGEAFNIRKFNKAFEKAKKRGNTDIEVLKNPKEKNAQDEFVGINDDYGDMFGHSSGNYAGVEFGSTTDNFLDTDLNDSGDEGDSYYDHNKNRDGEYKKSLEDLIKQREQETAHYRDMSFKDFNTNMEEGYGFLHEVGYNKNYELSFSESKDMDDRYKRLLDERKKMDNEQLKEAEEDQKHSNSEHKK